MVLIVAQIHRDCLQISDEVGENEHFRRHEADLEKVVQLLLLDTPDSPPRESRGRGSDARLVREKC